ncbi:heme lyase CcmF/NrfE family subunit [Solilutibacter tolerans]|uniref:Cytochrome c-type biogenesis protein CcmF n=1 Tax=Solilutibacter tolerans TaxID=1604334 RepID=A0A1N6W347_9GAMM|nr:heme lyase CcmF/NrfE family subunit [Lysobacter tolerans]SIQ84613.1 cytochrome c-type biogenesis protein CcmF [Lysobacter tolerans]
MLGELGHFALNLALWVAVIQSVIPLIGAHKGRNDWMAVARPAAFVQLALIAFAFILLTHAFVVQDRSLQYVADNSNSLLPMVYRFTAVWGAHEGSLLLWLLVLAGWTGAVAAFSRHLPLSVIARVLGVMGIVSIGFQALLLFTSDPFERLLPAASEGRDLNPLLQDPGMIIHPPMLYLGYVGFAVPFAFAIAALLDGKVDVRWQRWTRPWTNIAWGFLTLGIGLGSWWAYYELGWGGWWFWDPVENASFMPWLVGAALIHSQAVTEKRGSFANWTLLLAIAAFSLSLLGTFLVRSGAITSVHAFAADPERGMFILAYLGVVVGGSLLLYALRAPGATAEARPFAPFSRETLLLINNLLLTTAGAMVLIGTLYPMLADALELGKVSVGPPYFSLMFVLLMAPVVMLLPFGPLVRWQREQPQPVIAMLMPWAALALVIGAIAWWMAPQGAIKTGVGIAAALWVGLGTLLFAWQRLRKSGRMTREMTGMTLAHVGVALFVAGALLNAALNEQREVALAPGQTLSLHGDDYRFDGVRREAGPNYDADIGTVTLMRDGKRIATLHPEKRSYASGGQVMTEAAVDWGVFRDRYVALGESLGNGSWAVRVHSKPMMGFIWLAVVLIALGGFVTAADRRFRRYQEEKTT